MGDVPVGSIAIIPVRGIGEVTAGEDVAGLIRAAATAAGGPGLEDGDVVVVASKVVAKAAARTVSPHPGETTDQARRRLAIADSADVLAETPHVVVVRTPSGHVCANAGIDASNTPGGVLLLLPADPDADADAIRAALADPALGHAADVGVVIADTFGRAWREGQTDIALGVAGLPAVRDERGTLDREGRRLSVTLVAIADQLAGAADLVRDKAAGVPVVILRGTGLVGTGEGRGADLVRNPEADLFPHGRGWLARRLATRQGPAVRPGPPEPWEWDLVTRAAGDGSPTGATTYGTGDGVAAGIVLACLLDLGYPAELSTTDQGYVVTVG